MLKKKDVEPMDGQQDNEVEIPQNLLDADPEDLLKLCWDIKSEQKKLREENNPEYKPERERIATETYDALFKILYRSNETYSTPTDDSLSNNEKAWTNCSFKNQLELQELSKCGCFYCMKIFSPKEIVEWWDSAVNGTAVCPYCGIDSIIGERPGQSITVELLKEMHNYSFGGLNTNCACDDGDL